MSDHGTVPSASRFTPAFTHAVPGVRYRDARAAIAWLADVLGAERGAAYPGPDDTVAHAELWFGGACVMLGSLKDDRTPPTGPGQTGVYVVVRAAGDVDALHARAVAAGARVVRPPHDTDYGSRDFGCADPEGNVWNFGTYAPARPGATT